jgi:preprotein translocase subunit SecF
MQGDHIYIDCGFYKHHGIDCGNGTVIHFSKEKGKVCCDSIHTFAHNNQIYVKSHKRSYSSEEVVERAKSKVGETGYNLGFNNCEHFATWCKTGQRQSQQVDGTVGNIGGTATAAGLGAALGAIPIIETTVAAPGILGMLGMTTTSVVGLGALPVAAALGGAYLAYKLISHDDD